MSAAPNWLQDQPADRPIVELSLWSADLCRMADNV
jgi:hypothetical protein